MKQQRNCKKRIQETVFVSLILKYYWYKEHTVYVDENNSKYTQQPPQKYFYFLYVLISRRVLLDIEAAAL